MKYVWKGNKILTNLYQCYNGIGSFICLYITWKKWNFIPKFPPMEILLNIWWKSLHRNSRYCQNHQNGVTNASQKWSLTWKKWKIIHKFPPMEIILNIWWKSLHRNSEYCQNHQNRVTSCFLKMFKLLKKMVLCIEWWKYMMWRVIWN